MTRARIGVLAVTLIGTLGCGGTTGAAAEGHGAEGRGAEGASLPAHAQGHPGAEGHGHAGHHGGGHHDFSDAEAFAEIFDDPERDAWQKPEEVVALLELEEGDVVADLGAGTGYFLPHLSPAVGDTGRVLALDVEEAMVEHMRERVERAGLDNVEVRQVDPDDPGLDPSSVHRILIVNTWHHIADRPAYAALLRETLREDGAVAVVDFTADSPHGPPAPMRLAPERIEGELREGGLHPRRVEETLPHQYVILGWRSPPDGQPDG